MRELIKKYVVLNVVAKLSAAIIPAILIVIFPKLLTFEYNNGNTRTFGLAYLKTPLIYLFNLIIAIFIAIDIRKINIKSIPILLLTCLAGVTGTIIFLFVAYKNNFRRHE